MAARPAHLHSPFPVHGVVASPQGRANNADMSSPAPVIHVVDDDESFRTAVARLVRAAGYEVRMYASAGDFLLQRHDDVPGCILLDVRMPGPTGLQLQEALAAQQGLPVIFLSAHGDIAMTVRAMKAGAVDFLTKPVERKALLEAISQALNREVRARASREHLAALQARHGTLSSRERAVFERVVSGKPNKQIAAEIGTSERTVKAHRAQVMAKLQATSLPELVRFADELRAPASQIPRLNA
jgi:FixJ family two-component response regulator